MVSQLYVYGVVGVAAFAALAVLAAWFYWSRTGKEVEDALEAYLENLDEDEEVEFKPPDVRRSALDVLRLTRHYQRQQKLAKKGYVKWYRLGSTLSRPTWVKPRHEGSGAPKVVHDDQPYYFPKDAMVADSLTGAWVAMHREGEADPMNLRDPAYPGIEADLVERIINLEAESKPPGWLDGVLGGWDQQTLMWVGIGVLFLIYAAYQYSAGGLG